MQPRRVTPTPTTPRAGETSAVDASGGGSARKPPRRPPGGDGSTPVDAPADAERRAKRKRELDVVRRRLPVYASRERLVSELRKHETVIIVGETGSGKTTQIPQFAHEAGVAGGLMVACTQPRRVAAVSVARRVAEETGTALGDLVGYAIRFEEKSSPATRVKFLTDGMLLREAVTDATLSRYGVVMIDEAHERTLQTDFLLGTLRKTQDARRGTPRPLKIVVMSATLEAERFSSFFRSAPVVYSKGRAFPVETFYTETPEDDYLDAALCAVCQINEAEAAGDVLVFLTGQEEIESLGRLLRARSKKARPGAPALNVVLLFAAMPPEEQMRAFEPTPPGTRKVVLATNIAETSLTISGIRYVVDSGLTKRRIYHPKSGVDELLVAPVAVSQATQRAGRAGREAPGKCFRLYCEDAMRSLDPHVTPELLRTNLSGVVLQLKAMRVDDVLGFPFIDPPPREALVRSLELLYALGALNDEGALSVVGRKMARFPLEPMAAKAIVASAEEGCAEDVVAVLAMLTTDKFALRFATSPMIVSQKNRAAAVRARGGDHATLLAVFRAFSKCGAKRKKTSAPRTPCTCGHAERRFSTSPRAARARARVRPRATRARRCCARSRLVFPQRRAATGGREFQDGLHRPAPGHAPTRCLPSAAGDDPVQRAGQDQPATRGTSAPSRPSGSPRCPRVYSARKRLTKRRDEARG